ncbi:MAG: YkgJ family cysteine cluster protein [Thermodesulfobacteriota bacterium]
MGAEQREGEGMMASAGTDEAQCRRCGTCCRKGGPALHTADRQLVMNDIISLGQLVTVRQGEPAFNPVTGRVEATPTEFVKVAGKNGNWECIFFDPAAASCTIHDNRPLECRLLFCRNTEAVEAITGRDLLQRRDLIPDDHPLTALITDHEELCPATKGQSLLIELLAGSKGNDALDRFTLLLQQDLDLRAAAVARFHLSLGEELFFFGRPLFRIFHHPRLQVSWHGMTLALQLLP